MAISELTVNIKIAWWFKWYLYAMLITAWIINRDMVAHDWIVRKAFKVKQNF